VLKCWRHHFYHTWHNFIASRIKHKICPLANGGVAPRILNLGPRRMWVVSFVLRPLNSRGKSPRYTLDRRLGGPQSRSGSSPYPSRCTEWATRLLASRITRDTKCIPVWTTRIFQKLSLFSFFFFFFFFFFYQTALCSGNVLGCYSGGTLSAL
jgi:hypothetical protein